MKVFYFNYIRWKQNIEKGIENYPFFAWNVAIFIENVEKANALSR